MDNKRENHHEAIKDKSEILYPFVTIWLELLMLYIMSSHNWLLGDTWIRKTSVEKGLL